MNYPDNSKPPQQGKKILDLLRDQIRLKQYSPRMEKTYIQWVREYILFQNKRHPREMGIPEINQFITHLIVERGGLAAACVPEAKRSGIKSPLDA